MTEQEAFLVEVVERLEQAGIPYMISGSLASSFHGQPRATNDVDVVIAPTAAQLDSFLDSLEESYYFSREAAHDALQRRSMFNVIDVERGYKADLVVRKDRSYSQEEFARRRPEPLLNRTISLVTPEDAILSKLEWSKQSESERQYRDAVGVAVQQWKHLERDYLTNWAEQLGVADLLARLLREAEMRQAANP